MKQTFVILGLAFLLTSCIGKKRTTYASKDKSRTERDGSTNGHSTKESEEFVHFRIGSIDEYIETFSGLAQEEMRLYGIPASITLAQGILESGFGQGELTLKTNNHFGIKCHAGWDGPFETYDDDARGECFRKYNHPRQSYRDHSLFLSTRSRYASLFKLRKDNYKGWAKGLRSAGYATDRRYAQKLISFIERYDLNQFDKEVLRGRVAARKTKNRSRANEVHVVEKGDTLYSISRRYLIPVNELMEINNMRDTLISIGQELKVKSLR